MEEYKSADIDVDLKTRAYYMNIISLLLDCQARVKPVGHVTVQYDMIIVT